MSLEMKNQLPDLPAGVKPEVEEEFSEAEVSKFDTVASGMVSMLFHLTIIVIGLATFLFHREYKPRADFTVSLADVGGGIEEGTVGESMELNSPVWEGGSQEVMEITDTPRFEDALTNATSVVSTQAISLADPEQLDAPDPRPRAGRSKGTGSRIGKGFGEGAAGYPRSMRWEILFPEGSTMQSYAQQLDFFGIELGVLGVGNQVTYVTNLQSVTPTTRTKGPNEEEERLHFAWRQGKLQQLDRKLAAKAGVPADGKIIVHFYPPQTENMLAVLEQQYAGRKPEEIRRTRFGVRNAGRGFEFYVIDQFYLY